MVKRPLVSLLVRDFVKAVFTISAVASEVRLFALFAFGSSSSSLDHSGSPSGSVSSRGLSAQALLGS